MTMKLGTAVWADERDVEAGLPYQDGTVWLGRLRNGAPVGYGDDRHVCLVSGSRSGKGTSSIINSLCLWPGSAVVVDPKGENATVTAARRGAGSAVCEGMGQAVHVLDPFRAATVEERYRSRFNPLDALNPESEESIDEAGRLADAIVVQGNSQEPFWEEAARTLIKGLILHVLTWPGFEGRRNLVTLRELITRGDRAGLESYQQGPDADQEFSAHDYLWAAVRSNEALAGVIAGIGDNLAGMRRNSAKQFESVLQTAAQHTEFIDSPAMRRCLEASDFSLRDVKASPHGMSLYLSLPQRYMNTHYRWLRMMIALVVTEAEIVRGKPKTGFPVLMLLDEFAGLKRMEVIENAVAQIAGFGVKLFFVLQSLEQLKAVYKDNWETFLSNAGLKVFFGIDDHFTREYVSKLIGETEVSRDVRSIGENFSRSHGTSQGRSESFGTSRSTGQSQTAGTSASAGQSHSRGVNQSTSESETQGTNSSKTESSGGSTGKSSGSSWSPDGGGFSLQSSSGMNWSHSSTSGTSQSWSRSTSQGTSESWSDSFTRGTSESRSDSVTEGTSRTDGVTSGVTEGWTEGRNVGTAETLHRRALISPDEIGKMFARVGHPDSPRYPGLALVLIAGAPPIMVRRVNYFEDPLFIARFEPHPDHEGRPLQFLRLRSDALDPFVAALPGLAATVGVTAGDVVPPNAALAELSTNGTHGAYIRCPVEGRVERILSHDDDGTPILFGVVHYEQPISVHPFAELVAWMQRTKALIENGRGKQLLGTVAGALIALAGIAAMAQQGLVGAGTLFLGLGLLIRFSSSYQAATRERVGAPLRK